MEGAGRFAIFTRDRVPAAGPRTGTVAILTGLIVWNDFFTSLVFLNVSDAVTLPVVVYSFVGTLVSRWNVVFAAVLLSMVPVLVLYLLPKEVHPGVRRRGQGERRRPPHSGRVRLVGARRVAERLSGLGFVVRRPAAGRRRAADLSDPYAAGSSCGRARGPRCGSSPAAARRRPARRGRAGGPGGTHRRRSRVRRRWVGDGFRIEHPDGSSSVLHWQQDREWVAGPALSCPLHPDGSTRLCDVAPPLVQAVAVPAAPSGTSSAGRRPSSADHHGRAGPRRRPGAAAALRLVRSAEVSTSRAG